MNNIIKQLVQSLIDWLFRRRSPAIVTMKIGLTCLSLALAAGVAFDLSLPLNNARLKLRFTSAGDVPSLVVYSIGTLGTLLICIGLIWEILRQRSTHRTIDRKSITVIEARGLRDTPGAPLIDAIPPRFQGHKQSMIIDLRQQINDGEIFSPTVALEALLSLPADLKRRHDDLNRSDHTMVYGGLAPVPFTFLIGVLIDDEGPVSILDWDRHTQRWRELDADDDQKRFRSTGLDQCLSNTPQAAVTVSVSYRIRLSDVRETTGDLPTVTLCLDDGSPHSHWSEEKQRALSRQFLDTSVRLHNAGVERIHLFLAAPSSVVFRFGRHYDKRNLPQLIVYQYQRNSTPRYPWGLLMPVSGVSEPDIVFCQEQS